MVEDETIRSLPEKLGRHCPTCGARVADGATACSICGAALDDEPQAGEADNDPGAPPGGDRRSHRARQILRIAVLALIAVVTLVGAAALGLEYVQRRYQSGAAHLHPTVTFQPTATATPTVTPSATPTSPPTETPTPVPPIEYTVVAGDTLLAIAVEYGVSVDELIAYNGLDSDAIGEGQTLLIPAPTPTPGPTPTLDPGQPTETPSPYILHTVRAGDTLSTIAEQYGVSIEVIRAENELPANSQHIVVGLCACHPAQHPHTHQSPWSKPRSREHR